MGYEHRHVGHVTSQHVRATSRTSQALYVRMTYWYSSTPAGHLLSVQCLLETTNWSAGAAGRGEALRGPRRPSRAEPGGPRHQRRRKRSHLHRASIAYRSTSDDGDDNTDYHSSLSCVLAMPTLRPKSPAHSTDSVSVHILLISVYTFRFSYAIKLQWTSRDMCYLSYLFDIFFSQ